MTRAAPTTAEAEFATARLKVQTATLAATVEILTNELTARELTIADLRRELAAATTPKAAPRRRAVS